MEMTAFPAFVVSLGACMALIPPLVAWSARLQTVDVPDARKIHTRPISRIGGVAIAVGPLASVWLWAPQTPASRSYLIGAVMVWLLGVWDDRTPLNFKIKFLVQCAAALIVVWYGELRVDRLPFWPDLVLPSWLTAGLAVFLVLAVTNAVNLSDGLDGLAGGVCVLTFAAMAYLGYLVDAQTITLITVAVLGSLLGFLRFNTHPARVFMGDGGSQFLGFSAGVAVVLLMRSGVTDASPLLVLFILGLPIVDTVGVMAQRMVEGRSLFLPDKNHIHHKLLAIGLLHHEAVLAIYAVHAGMVFLGVLLSGSSEVVIAPLYAVISGSILTLFLAAGRIGAWWKRREGERSRSMTAWTRFRASRWLTDAPLQVLGIGVPVFLLVGVFLPRDVPPDFGALAAGLFSLLLIGLAAFRRAAPFLVRVGLYVSGTFVLYLSDQEAMAAEWPMRTAVNGFFAATAVLVLIAIRFQRGARFETTPLDYLLVFLAVLIPSLPHMGLGGAALGLLMTKLLVLFFAYELLLHALSERLIPLGAVSLWVLLGLGVRAWW